MAVTRTDTRTAILSAALDIIAENGFHEAPTAAIASRAGVGVGSIYRYFKDKEELIHSLYAEVSRRILPRILEGEEDLAGLPLREQFLRLWRGTCDYLIENPREFRFLEQYYDSPFGLAQKRAELFSETGEGDCPEECKPFNVIFERGRREQIIKDLPVTVLYALSFGPVTALIKDAMAGLVDLNDDTLTRFLEAIWDALKR